ncbi:MAG TPA: alcohol dehydrogenase catalytic domain-containing protein [Acidimicrobiales bacterium]|nr:alcohol dehydrogenase catalytic domain-containing protein [Acidimicrobiales bacterium]
MTPGAGGRVVRALVTDGDGGLELREAASRPPGPGELAVAPVAVGVCGTDLELIDGVVDAAFVNYPLVLGHEWSGIVTGSESAAFSPGDRVVVEGIVPCRHCDQCVTGATNLCDTYDEIGFTRGGAATDELVVPADLAHLLPEAASFEDGALVEPSSVVYRGLSRVLSRPGLDCLVVGDGTIALLALQLLRLWSPARLALLGRRPEQAGLAWAAGASELVDPRSPPTGRFDLVVEAAGSNEAVLTALAAARRGGTVLVLGLPPQGTTAAIAVDGLVNNDLLVRASFGYTSSAWRRVVALIGAGSFHPSGIVTHRFPIGQFSEGFELLRAPRPGEARGKVLLYLDGVKGEVSKPG